MYKLLPTTVYDYMVIFYLYREMSLNDLQMKELQDQLEAEQYFSVSTYILARLNGYIGKT